MNSARPTVGGQRGMEGANTIQPNWRQKQAWGEVPSPDWRLASPVKRNELDWDFGKIGNYIRSDWDGQCLDWADLVQLFLSWTRVKIMCNTFLYVTIFSE